MQTSNDSNQPVDRVAAGVKTALFVCVIGFIALMANRALVAPGGAPAVETPVAAPSMIAPDTRTPSIVPSDNDAMATLRSMTNDGGVVQDDEKDNHPASF